MLIFWIKLYFLPVKKMELPDVIIVSSISLLPILNAFNYKSRLNKKPKIILEVRDIWPLSLIELGGFSKYNPFVLFLSWVEKSAYMNCDYVTSVLPLAYKHFDSIAGKKVPFKHISNGIHVESLQNIESIGEEIEALIPKNRFIIGYTGAIGVANAMEYFVDTAISLKDDISICFVIVGDGYMLDSLKIKSKGLDNIVFIDRINKRQVQSILQKFDLLYIGWHNLDLYKFGISANKIFDYMYSGKPVLMPCNIEDSEIQVSKCGFLTSPTNINEIRETILNVKELSVEKRKEIGSNGKAFVEKYRTYEYITDCYVHIFQELKIN